MPFGVQVQVLSRAPDHDNFDYSRPQGDFLLPSGARNISESGLAVRLYKINMGKNFIVHPL